MKKLTMLAVVAGLAATLTGCNCGICFPNYRPHMLPSAPLPNNNCPPPCTYTTGGPTLAL